MTEKKRLVLVDYLKALCVVFVIITHSDFLNEAMLDKSGLFYLLVVNKAVPVFMFLSGYVFAIGAKNKTLSEQYGAKKLIGKLLRLTIPTVIAYIIYVVLKFGSGDAMSPYEIVRCFLAGNYGMGSYYYAIMVQFVFLAPLMYQLVKRYAHWGVVILGGINLLHEIVWTATAWSDGIYRILVLRYVLIIAFGMLFAELKDKKIKSAYLALMAAIGLCYILLPYFTDYEYKIFTVDPWNLSGMMPAFYVAAVMYVVFKLFGKAQEKGAVSRMVSKVGQASYHIMYTQMMYFFVRPAIDQRIIDITALPLWSQYIVDIVVSVALGLVFCVLDSKIFGKFYKTK